MPRKPRKDRTSLILSVAIHAVLIGGVVFWAYKTGKLEQMRQAVLQYVKGEKQEEKKSEPIQQKQTAAPRLPPINQGLKSPASSGTRRAVAAEAPEAVGGGSFFQDTRRQIEGPSTAGASGAPRTNVVAPAQMARATPPKPIFTPPPSSVKQLLVERAAAAAMVESFGAEQIAKAAVKDVGDIVAKLSGSTIVEGKFAVIRGLSDRYTSTLLNGTDVPSGDPYRRSVQLDLFPSAMVERVAISKTYTPDQPGGTGGSTIDVLTKSFPERTFFKFTTGVSYNENSNLRNDFLADPRSSMAMFDLPGGPAELADEFYNLNAPPPVPGPSSSRETIARALERRQQADAQAALLQSLGTTDFAGIGRDSPLNSSLSASAGDTLFLFRRPVGVFGALNYSRNFKFYSDIQLSRSNNRGFVEKSGYEDQANITTDLGVNFNLGYKLSDEVELGFNYLLAHTTDEEARHTVYDYLASPEGDTLEQWQLHFTDREINNYQFRGKVELPPLAESRLDWVLNLADTAQKEPDHRFMNYFIDAEGRARLGDAGLPVPQFPSRYFRDIAEESLNAKVDWTLPFRVALREGSLKTGWFFSRADREFREQYFGYTGSSGFDVNHPNSYLDQPDLLNYQTMYLGGIRTNFSFARSINLATGRPYTASSEITAGYFMTDLGVLPWLRVIGGARWEHTFLTMDAFRDAQSELNQLDVLPAISAVVSLATNLSLRLGYAETVARPSFREKSPILNYLPDRKVFARGNADLQMSAITSYDARLDWFPAPGELFSVGIFYKQLGRPIELYQVQLDGDDVTWINRDAATVMGVEFEARKSLRFLSPYFDGLTLGANLALIQSETELTDVEYQNKTDVDSDGVIDFPTSRTRPLYDQSPYVINLDLSYELPATGTSLSLAANLTGERISLATAQGDDQYEHPPVLLDFALTQKLGRKLSLRFGVRNLLDSEYRQTYGADATGALYQSYHRGRTFSVSLSAEF